MTKQQSEVRRVIYLDSATNKKLLKQAQSADRSCSWIIRKLINESEVKQEQSQ